MKKFLLLAVTLLGLQACTSSPVHIQAMSDPQLDPSLYATFAVEAAQYEDQFRQANAMIYAAIKQTMEAKGFSYHKPASEADLLVRFIAEVRHDQALSAEAIPTPQGVYTKYQMVAVNEGSLLLNIVDQDTKTVIWKGSILRDLNNYQPSQLTQERVNLRVEELLESMPAR